MLSREGAVGSGPMASHSLSDPSSSATTVAVPNVDPWSVLLVDDQRAPADRVGSEARVEDVPAPVDGQGRIAEGKRRVLGHRRDEAARPGPSAVVRGREAAEQDPREGQPEPGEELDGGACGRVRAVYLRRSGPGHRQTRERL